MELTRRAMLGALGGLAVGGTVASVVGTSIAADPKMKRFDQANGDFGWKPHKLDPNVCAPVATKLLAQGLCLRLRHLLRHRRMMGEQYGAPYSQSPFTMLEANKAGVSGWGTICGALYGAAAAFALFWGRKDRDAMVSELFRWYETTKLPIYDPATRLRRKRPHPVQCVGLRPLPHFRLQMVLRAQNGRKQQGTQ